MGGCNGAGAVSNAHTSNKPWLNLMQVGNAPAVPSCATLFPKGLRVPHDEVPRFRQGFDRDRAETRPRLAEVMHIQSTEVADEGNPHRESNIESSTWERVDTETRRWNRESGRQGS